SGARGDDHAEKGSHHGENASCHRIPPAMGTGRVKRRRRARLDPTLQKAKARRYAPWHFLNFLPEPPQQGSFRPMSLCSFTAVAVAVPPPCAANEVPTE